MHAGPGPASSQDNSGIRLFTRDFSCKIDPEIFLKTTVNRRGQTVVPAELRRRLKITAGTTLQWIDTGTGVRVIPIPKDVIGALRGSARTEGLSAKLLESRQRERRKAAP